jgi:hypothetical protein
VRHRLHDRVPGWQKRSSRNLLILSIDDHDRPLRLDGGGTRQGIQTVSSGGHECSLDRVISSQTALNAFCFLDAESALVGARNSEARWRTGDPRRPIDAVQVSVKDNIAATGMPTRFGSCALTDDQIWRPDSPSVARLLEAGPIKGCQSDRKYHPRCS